MPGEMKSQGRRRFALIASALLSLLILVTLALRLDWSMLGTEFQKVHWSCFPLLVLLTLATFWVRALRWRHLLPDGATVSRSSLFEATLVGFTANFVLPLRVGEVIRPWFLSRLEPVKFSVGLASIITERALDILSLMAMLGLTFAEMELLPPLLLVGARIMTILAFVILALLVTAYLGSVWIIRFGESLVLFILGKRAPILAEHLISLMEDFFSGLRGISSFKDLIWSVIWSIVLWILLALLYQIGLWGFGVDASALVGGTVCVMVALAVAAPGAPGFIGTFQLGCVLGLTLFGFSEEFSVAYSIVLHALQAFTVVAAGFIVLHRRGIHLIDIRKEAVAHH